MTEKIEIIKEQLDKISRAINTLSKGRGALRLYCDKNGYYSWRKIQYKKQQKTISKRVERPTSVITRATLYQNQNNQHAIKLVKQAKILLKTYTLLRKYNNLQTRVYQQAIKDLENL